MIENFHWNIFKLQAPSNIMEKFVIKSLCLFTVVILDVSTRDIRNEGTWFPKLFLFMKSSLLFKHIPFGFLMNYIIITQNNLSI